LNNKMLRMDGAVLRSINFMLESCDETDTTPMDAFLWVGFLEGEDGARVHGLHLANADYPEEGSITLVEFPPDETPP